MLQSTPYARLSSADIIGHQWLAGGAVASADQVKNELNKRSLAIKARKIAGRDRFKGLHSPVYHSKSSEYMLFNV